MKRSRFQYLCQEAEAGRDAFVRHGSSHEDGIIMRCDLVHEYAFVKTAKNEERSWFRSECEDIPRAKSGPIA